jgi:hypothetical protein
MNDCTAFWHGNPANNHFSASSKLNIMTGKDAASGKARAAKAKKMNCVGCVYAKHAKGVN